MLSVWPSDERYDPVKICSRCGQEIPLANSKYCPNCGNELDSRPRSESPTDYDDLEFQITEAADDDRQLIGQDTVTEPVGEELGVLPPHEEISEPQSYHEDRRPGDVPVNDLNPVEGLAPILPEPSGSIQQEQPPLLSSDSPFDSEELSETSRQQLKKLSEDEIKQINQQMYAREQVPDPSAAALSEQQKQELVTKLKGIERPFGNEPIKPGDASSPPPPDRSSVDKSSSMPESVDPVKPAADRTGVKMATHGQGTAFFWKNYIQIMSNQSLKSEDTITIGNRIYSLKPKQLNMPMVIGGGSAVVALLLILIAVAVFSGGGSGTGKIFGIALDAYDQPYVQSAIIRFPELGRELRSDAQGFFALDGLKTGTYKIEYVIGAQIVRTDFATVVNDKITTVALRPEYVSDYDQKQELSDSDTDSESHAADRTTVSAPEQKPRQGTRSSNRPGSLVLSANVDNARLSIDGDILGVGNLTYTGIKAGKRRWEVSADGYKTASGSLTLASGDQQTIKVTLQPVEREKSPAERAMDLLVEGQEALKADDFVLATEQLKKAIKLDPSLAEAHFELGEAMRYATELEAAYNHYLRAAEIFRLRQQRNAALTALNRAIELNGNRTDAYVGRAGLYLDNNSVQIAIDDLETAEKIDKNDPQVQYGLGEAYYTLADYKKATKYFDKARKLSPQDPLPYQALMLCYAAREDHKKVRRTHEEFMSIATEQDVKRFRTDNAYSSVWEVVDSE
jgi:Tfp pilus assembly protein PilF